MNWGGEQKTDTKRVVLAWANLFLGIVYFLSLVLIIIAGVFTVEATIIQKVVGFTILALFVVLPNLIFLANFLILRKMK